MRRRHSVRCFWLCATGALMLTFVALLGCDDQPAEPAAKEAVAEREGVAPSAPVPASEVVPVPDMGSVAAPPEEVAAPADGPALKLRVFGEEEEANPARGGDLELEIDPALVPKGP